MDALLTAGAAPGQGSTKIFVSACPVGQVDHTFGCPVGRTTCPHFLFIFFIFNQSLFSVAKIKWEGGGVLYAV